MSQGQNASLEWKHFSRHHLAYEQCLTLPGVNIFPSPGHDIMALGSNSEAYG